MISCQQERGGMSNDERIKMRTIFLYLDEAGNFDFSEKGSRYYILTCVAMRRPFHHVAPLSSIKYDLIEQHRIPKHLTNYFEFHASEDPQSTRDLVFNCIGRYLDRFAIYCGVFEKSRIPLDSRDPHYLYASMFRWLIEQIAVQYPKEINRIVVVTDTIPVKKRSGALRQTLKSNLNDIIVPMGMEYELYHHSSESDCNLQIADYCCWAVQRKWERDDDRSYRLIEQAIAQIYTPA